MVMQTSVDEGLFLLWRIGWSLGIRGPDRSPCGSYDFLAWARRESKMPQRLDLIGC